jgi:cellulase/cellobiase CelA1
MIALYLALLNGFTPDICRTHIIDETFIQNQNKKQRKDIKENFMDNSRAGWIGWIFPVIVLVTLFTVILTGLYECTSRENKGLDSIGLTNLPEYIITEQGI